MDSISVDANKRNLPGLAGQLLSRYEEIKCCLTKAIDDNCEETVQFLDRELSQCWISLLNIYPTVQSEKEALIEFYMHQLSTTEVGGNLNEQSQGRIISLSRNEAPNTFCDLVQKHLVRDL